MTYVLDASVAFKWEVTEVDSDKATRLRDAARQSIHEFIAPNVFPAEVAHSMTRAERQRRVLVADGWRLWQSIMLDAPALMDYVPLIQRA